VSRSIFGMPIFREPCSPLHQGEEQPDTDTTVSASHSDEVDCKIHETLAFQEWIRTWRKSAKRIIFKYNTLVHLFILLRCIILDDNFRI
ncbi:hypothetical protein ALC56_01951, partial [Trachymyrmex septentrionalis]